MDTHNDTPLHTAVALIGGPSALAKHFGISPAAISLWLKKGKAPSNRCLRIEQLCGGAVTRYDLDPAVFGAPPKKHKRP